MPTLTVVLTATWVVLSTTSTAPASKDRLEDSDGLSEIDPVSLAAMPPVVAGVVIVAAWAGTTRMAPEATVTVTKVVVPLPRVRATSLRPIWISPVVAFFWNENDPVRR